MNTALPHSEIINNNSKKISLKGTYKYSSSN